MQDQAAFEAPVGHPCERRSVRETNIDVIDGTVADTGHDLSVPVPFLLPDPRCCEAVRLRDIAFLEGMVGHMVPYDAVIEADVYIPGRPVGDDDDMLAILRDLFFAQTQFFVCFRL